LQSNTESIKHMINKHFCALYLLCENRFHKIVSITRSQHILTEIQIPVQQLMHLWPMIQLRLIQHCAYTMRPMH